MHNDRQRELSAPPPPTTAEELASLTEEEIALTEDLAALRAGDMTRVPPWLTLTEAIAQCEQHLGHVLESKRALLSPNR